MKAIPAMIAFLLAACSAPKYEQLALRITDGRDGRPIAGAEVVVRPLKFYFPMDDSPSPTPGDFHADRGQTDAAGLIILRAAGNAPSELTATHPAYPTWMGLVEPWESANGLLQWRLDPVGFDPNLESPLRVEIAPR